MATVSALALEKQADRLAEATACALVGDDATLVRRCLGIVRNALTPADQPGSSVREFEDQPEPRQIFDELQTIPFMGMRGRRVVVIRNADAFVRANGERLTAYLEKPVPTSALVLCLTKLDGRTKVAKLLASKGVVVDCSSPRWREAEGWARAKASELGLKLTPRAAQSLMEAIGPNVVALGNELDKLAAYTGSNGTVTERDVEELVPAGRARRVFDLTDAVASGDAGQAMRLCGRLLLRGESREGLVALLGRQIRQQWQVKRLKDTGATEKEIQRELDLHPYVVSKSLKLVAGVSEARFARQLQRLSDADYESKVASLRATEERVWLENLLASLCEK